MKRICSTNSDCRITCLVVLVSNSDKEIEKDVAKNDNTTRVKEVGKSKRKRKDSEENLDAKKLKTTKDAENKGINSSAKKSVVPEVVCTRGQKWEVEDI